MDTAWPHHPVLLSPNVLSRPAARNEGNGAAPRGPRGRSDSTLVTVSVAQVAGIDLPALTPTAPAIAGCVGPHPTNPPYNEERYNSQDDPDNYVFYHDNPALCDRGTQ